MRWTSIQKNITTVHTTNAAAGTSIVVSAMIIPPFPHPLDSAAERLCCQKL